ncbi:MAG: acyltransferase family protein [Gammaproteobacteria bacterium]
MHPTTSVYLDLVRFTAAMMVVLSHAAYPHLGGDWLGAAGELGRDAVMIFFVLSGYVIAYVVQEREADARSYALSRLSRIYSVAAPALVITVLADALGAALDPQFYADAWHIDSKPLPRFVVSLLFLNEYWFESVRAFSNGPYWSLSYEVCYYIIFGAWCYASRGLRPLLVGGVLLLAGPKILLLFPVWLMGVAAYHFNRRVTLPKWLALGLVLGSIAGFMAYEHFEIAVRGLHYMRDAWGADFVDGQLKYSRFFLGANLLGLLLMVHFVGVQQYVSQSSFVVPRAAARVIGRFAGLTFSLYLMHYPLLHLYFAVTGSSLPTLGLCLLTIAAVGAVTEQKKHLWKRLFEQVFAFGDRQLRPLLSRRQEP